MRIGLVQTRTGIDPERSASELHAAVERLAAQGCAMAFLPEMCGILDRNSARLRAAVRREGDDPVLTRLRGVAREGGIALSIGSLAILREDGAIANRGFVISPDGGILAHYDKLHLFDVELGPGESYRESATFAAGDAAVVAALPWGRLGLSICYDLRFPALFTALAAAGADMLAVPAAFTVPTGRAHWHVLLRARAIETGCFVIAAAQAGRHEDGRETFGHALVVGPWGDIRLDMGEDAGEAVVDIDLADVGDARRRIPALAHRRPIPPPALARARPDGA